MRSVRLTKVVVRPSERYGVRSEKVVALGLASIAIRSSPYRPNVDICTRNLAAGFASLIAPLVSDPGSVGELEQRWDFETEELGNVVADQLFTDLRRKVA